MKRVITKLVCLLSLLAVSPGLAMGTSVLNITRIILGDANGDPLPIPEPTTISLLCFGITGIYVVRKMKERSNIQ